MLMIPFEEYFHPQFKSFLKEGLIKTYPAENLKRVLDNTEFKTTLESYVSDESTGHGESSKVITIVLSPKPKIDNFIQDANSDVDTLKKLIDRFGFFIGHLTKHTRLGRIAKNDDATFHYKISVEPKYPSTATTEIGSFYHITYDRYIPKIKKIGLTPRTSKTSFSHPGNRIYLLRASNIGKVADLMTAISDNRLSNIPDHIVKKGENAIDIYKILNDVSKMIVYKVNVDGLKLYEDPMVDPSEQASAFFTMENISPDRLQLIE